MTFVQWQGEENLNSYLWSFSSYSEIVINFPLKLKTLLSQPPKQNSLNSSNAPKDISQKYLTVP